MRTVAYPRIVPYQSVPAGAIARPMLPVRLSVGAGWTPPILAIVDSGADRSIFRTDVALLLGLDVATLPISQTSGIGGPTATYQSIVDMEVEGVVVSAEVDFLPGLPVLGLLGREDIFARLAFGFDQQARELLIRL